MNKVCPNCSREFETEYKTGCAVENCEKEKPCPGCKYFMQKPVEKAEKGKCDKCAHSRDTCVYYSTSDKFDCKNWTPMVEKEAVHTSCAGCVDFESVKEFCRDCFKDVNDPDEIRKNYSSIPRPAPEPLIAKPMSAEYFHNSKSAPACRSLDKLIERVCELERELAGVREVLEDETLANEVAMDCVSPAVAIAVINAYRQAVRERIREKR